jgi:hypothetical protein
MDIKPSVKLERLESIKREKNTSKISLERAPKREIKENKDQVDLSEYTLREWSNGIDMKPDVKLERLEPFESQVKRESNAKLNTKHSNPIVKLKRLKYLESPVDKENSSGDKKVNKSTAKVFAQKSKKEKSQNGLQKSSVNTNILSRNGSKPFTDIISNGCTFKCRQCGKHFDVFGTLRIHVSKVHHEMMSQEN